jgi:hypothetical protein
MIYSSSLREIFARESPFDYPIFPSRDYVYEISLRTATYTDWLKELQSAHRLVQTLVQGEIMGRYRLLDFLIWPEGVFIRVSLQETRSLADFLRHLKEKSSPPGESPERFWDEDLKWIRLISPENLDDSSRLFLERADEIRREVSRSFGFSPSLFFFYRDPRLSASFNKP